MKSVVSFLEQGDIMKWIVAETSCPVGSVVREGESPTYTAIAADGTVLATGIKIIKTAKMVVEWHSVGRDFSPLLEEVKAPEPVAPEPVAPEPVADEPAPVADEPVADNRAYAVEETVADEPVADEPVADEPEDDFGL